MNPQLPEWSEEKLIQRVNGVLNADLSLETLVWEGKNKMTVLGFGEQV